MLGTQRPFSDRCTYTEMVSSARDTSGALALLQRQVPQGGNSAHLLHDGLEHKLVALIVHALLQGHVDRVVPASLVPHIIQITCAITLLQGLGAAGATLCVYLVLRRCVKHMQ